MIVIVESGGSNINSVRFALARLGMQAELTADPEKIRAASHVILPGVGAAAPGMKKLRDRDLINCLQTLEQPVLGVCLGMQLLYRHSEEADTDCLNIIEGEVRQLEGKGGLSVPHMGWNTIQANTDHPLLAGLDGAWFYFVHSFAAPVNEHCLASTHYGDNFCAIAGRDNFYAAQFHPEKSASAGERFLRNFLLL